MADIKPLTPNPEPQHVSPADQAHYGDPGSGSQSYMKPASGDGKPVTPNLGGNGHHAHGSGRGGY